jgi:hypothetical protein
MAEIDIRPELLFVYNADNSLFSQVTDYIHKVVSPATYQCNLCKLTHHNLGMKQEWKHFLQALPYELKFLHRNEFISNYPDHAHIALPAIYLMRRDLKPVAYAEEINNIHKLSDLKILIQKRLRQLPYD